MKDLRNKLFSKFGFTHAPVLLRRTVRGFTLIELLVAITIIGLLATVATFSANKALERNRDLKRQALINETADALEKYYYAQRQYPNSTDMTNVTSTSWCSAQARSIWWRRDFINPGVNFVINSCVTPIIPNLTPRYIASLPQDPKFDPATEIRGFMYYSDGNNYKLVSYNNVESVTKIPTNDPLYDQSLIKSDCLIAKSYSIFSPGGGDFYWGIVQNPPLVCP